MVYNKTKRGLEMAAGIVGIVYSAIAFIGAIYYLVLQFIVYDIITTGFALGLFSIVMALFTVCSLIFSAKLIKSPFVKDDIVKNTTTIRVIAMIFAGLTGNIVTLGLMIVVVCLKDFVEKSSKVKQKTIVVQQEIKRPDTIDSKVAEIKRFKELGIIDDEQYAKAIKKIVEDIK